MEKSTVYFTDFRCPVEVKYNLWSSVCLMDLSFFGIFRILNIVFKQLKIQKCFGGHVYEKGSIIRYGWYPV